MRHKNTQALLEGEGVYCFMPGRKHLSKASAKENRMYEHIRDSEIKKEGRSPKRAKQIAAATVRKRQNAKKK